jgi:homoserine dehydrogenase
VVAFDASVAGGIPIVAAILQSLAANQISAIQGILNGTSNFILTSMAEREQSYAAALKEAQERGYAEADPALDVDGSDAAHKLAILAQIAFGVPVPFASIERFGIADMHAMDLRFAHELGYTIKLLAEAWLDGSEVALQVAPVLLRHTDMLAQVRGAFNAIQVVGDAVGEMMFQGAGAGALPTASAVVADLIDIAVGRAQKTFAAAKLWAPNGRGFTLRTAYAVRSRFYLRVLVEDKPGMLADVARALADHQISIASVIQHEALEDHVGEIVPLVIMTHYAPTGRFREAVRQINTLKGVVPPGVFYSVDD